MAGAAAPKSQPHPSSTEEEALKMKTDCVYFLASPLTCKKGNECEYRHSDFARANPMDCWFWLNSNCLNPKCRFRHLPLDGLMETQIPTPTGYAQPLLPQTATMPPLQAVKANNTQRVPCKFFQSGFCLKGDWCPFLHAPNSMKNKASVVPVTDSTTEPSNLNKVEMPMLGKKVPPTNKGEVKSFKKVADDAKPDVHVNELSRNKGISDTSCINELPDYNCHPVPNRDAVNQIISVQQPHMMDELGVIDDKDLEDVSREPSPGFDVLVDDKGRDSDFYGKEDRYGMGREYEAGNEYDIDHLTDYNMIAETDNDRYQDRPCYVYDSQGYPNGQYGLERNRASPEWMSAGFYLKTRPYDRADLDLRYPLARPHGLKSVIIHDNLLDDHKREALWRLEREAPPSPSPRHDNLVSNRLQGRIRLPRRSSSPIDRVMIRRDDNGRLYSVRAILPSNSNQERIKAREENAFGDEWMNHQLIGDMRLTGDFDGPKSLAELKRGKLCEGHVMDEQQLGKRKQWARDARVSSFEGPKSLEEILKQKTGERFGNMRGRKSQE